MRGRVRLSTEECLDTFLRILGVVQIKAIVISARPAQQGGPGGPWPTQHICDTRMIANKNTIAQSSYIEIGQK